MNWKDPCILFKQNGQGKRILLSMVHEHSAIGGQEQATSACGQPPIFLLTFVLP